MKVYVRTWLAALMPSSFALERDATSMSWAFVRFFSSVFNDITAIYLNYSSVAPVMSKKSVNKTRWRLQRQRLAWLRTG